MDEPTAVLAPREAEALFATLRRLAARGVSIVFISHKLDEVTAISDRVTVLRAGRVQQAGIAAASTSKRELARLMVGRDVAQAPAPRGRAPGGEVLRLEEAWADGDRGIPALRGVSLEVRAGEIVGIAGVSGNGQRELAEAVTGTRRLARGRVLLFGRDVTRRPVRGRIDAGVAHVPEDGRRTGVVASMSVRDNLVLKRHRRPPLCGRFFVDRGAAARFARRRVEALDIKTPSIDAPAGSLSGGNLQKLILARELEGEPRLVVAVHPTCGVDVGARRAIHELLIGARERGAAVLLVSEDLDEILELADRIAVMYGGEVVGRMAGEGADRLGIGLMMAGAGRDARGEAGA